MHLSSHVGSAITEGRITEPASPGERKQPPTPAHDIPAGAQGEVMKYTDRGNRAT